ncbi:Uncharacterised protein [Vibrio cholerae]|nr:Uncharacterised protein [Vibrio cholerae]
MCRSLTSASITNLCRSIMEATGSPIPTKSPFSIGKVSTTPSKGARTWVLSSKRCTVLSEDCASVRAAAALVKATSPCKPLFFSALAALNSCCRTLSCAFARSNWASRSPLSIKAIIWFLVTICPFAIFTSAIRPAISAPILACRSGAVRPYSSITLSV